MSDCPYCEHEKEKRVRIHKRNAKALGLLKEHCDCCCAISGNYECDCIAEEVIAALKGEE